MGYGIWNFFLIHIWWFFLKWSKANVLLNLKNHKSIWSIEIFFQKAHYDIDVYRYRYRIGIGRYEKNLIGNLSDRPIWKMGFIGAYRYLPLWKKLIGCTLTYWEIFIEVFKIFLSKRILILCIFNQIKSCVWQEFWTFCLTPEKKGVPVGLVYLFFWN